MDQILREKLGDCYERRVAFDDHFEDGKKFRYGALNIGGMGAMQFGDHCVTLKDSACSNRERLAYLKSDSLKSYVREGQRVDDEAIREDVAPHSHRQYLAALRHSADVPATPEDRWPAILFAGGDYVEAIFVGDLTPEQVESVRLRKTECQELWGYAFEEFRGKLSNSNRFRADTFAMILRHLDRYGIRLEEVDDD